MTGQSLGQCSSPATPMLLGRSDELAWLRRLWDDANGTLGAPAGPRLAVLVGETGLGKSAIVQGFFEQLRNDPEWHPTDAPYWGALRGAPGSELRLYPHVNDAHTDALPRFLWLGVRWPAPDTRNVRHGTTELPTLRAQVEAHLTSVEQRIPRWRRRVDSLVNDVRDHPLRWATTVGSKLATAAMPGGVGLAVDTVTALLRSPSAEREDPVEELLSLLRVGAGARLNRLPLIVWLDDAHWMDPVTTQFVQRLLESASNESWPLLVIATHWEREWRVELTRVPEVATAREPMGFVRVATTHNAAVRFLEPAPREDLGRLIDTRFPGLTQTQRVRLLDKASGNFLTMVENLSELQRHAQCFVGRDPLAALSTFGERYVDRWESDRTRRVAQRFDELDPPELRDLLAFGAAVGTMFPLAVLATMLADLTGEPAEACTDRARLLVDPYVILEEIDDRLVGFRDRAFADVARRHFEEIWPDQHAAVTMAVMHHLAAWTDTLFDGSGELRMPQIGRWTSTERAATARLVTIGLAMVSQADVATASEWFVPTVRWHVLGLLLAAQEQLWADAVRHQEALQVVPWQTMATGVVGPALRYRVARTGRGRRSATLALGILDASVHSLGSTDDRSAMRDRQIVETQLLRAERLTELGELADAADAVMAVLPIVEQLAGTSDDPAVRLLLLSALHRQAHLSGLQGRVEDLSTYAERAIGLSRQWMADGHDDVALSMLGSMCLNERGRLLLRTGQATDARRYFEESVQVVRQAESIAAARGRTDEVVRSLGYALDGLAASFVGLGDLAKACEALEEIVIARRERYELAPAPRYGLDLAYSLNQLAERRGELGEWDDAEQLSQEALTISRTLVEELDTQRSWRNLSFSLLAYAKIRRARQGPRRSNVTLLTEALELRRRYTDAMQNLVSQYELIEVAMLLSQELHALELHAEARQAIEDVTAVAKALSLQQLRTSDVRGARILEAFEAWSRVVSTA